MLYGEGGKFVSHAHSDIDLFPHPRHLSPHPATSLRTSANVSSHNNQHLSSQRHHLSTQPPILGEGDENESEGGESVDEGTRQLGRA